ncbi:MAG: ABC transporter ATP-binding protein [Candidatus Bipolaricaulia bacterium]
MMIACHDASKAYSLGERTLWALQGVDVQIDRGEFVAITGPSGSGKSTLMHLMGGLHAPTDGEVVLDDDKLSEMSTSALARLRRDRVGFVFQQFLLLARKSALANVELPALYAGSSARERRAQAEARLDEVGLADKARQRPPQLSGGERQRVAIARALMNDPPLLLADEPTGSLDTDTGEGILDLLSSLHEQGRTVVLVTHERYVAEIADRQIRLQDGQVLDAHATA